MSIFFSRCAQQVPPSGGPDDLYPPMLDTTKAENAIPANFSTEFNSSQITLIFDEYFQIDNPNKSVVITPPLENNPTYLIKGKKLIISLNNELRANTTYTFNFGSSIKDVTRGNKMKDFKYVFSTGTFIDSLSFTGTIHDAYSKAAMMDATVLLYEENTDSIVYQKPPVYFTKTNASGGFKMEYLKAGNYKVIALLEENDNYLFDRPTEMIGFIDSTVSITASDSIPSIDLVLFLEDFKTQLVAEKKYIHPGKVQLLMNRPSDSISVYAVDGFQLEEEEVFYSLTGDTIEFWLDTTEWNNSAISIGIKDIHNDFYDTINLGIRLPKKPGDYKLLPKHNTGKGLDIGKNVIFSFDFPVGKMDESKLKVLQDTLELDYSLKQLNGKQVEMISKWEMDQRYSIQLLPGAFTTNYGFTNDSSTVNLKTKSERDYGNLIFDLKLEEGDYHLSLLNGPYVVQDTSFSGNSFHQVYEKLPPGDYGFKLIFDHNKNGKWDTGNYLKHLHPERIEYYQEGISIRPGWDMEVNWEIK